MKVVPRVASVLGLVVTLTAAAGPVAVRGAAVPGAVTNLPGQVGVLSVDSATDGWATGTKNDGSPLVLHWNGRTWSSGTLAGCLLCVIDSVSALSPADAWLVGAAQGNKPLGNTLVFHWNGRTWTRVPSPTPKSGIGSNLVSVSAISRSDAWAVGDTAGARTSQSFTLALRWNGTKWTQVATPSPFSQDELWRVSADSPSDAWAVGDYSVGTGRNSTEKSLTLHWNGRTWAQVPAPSPGGFALLTGVTALSPSNAWAAGTYIDKHLPVCCRQKLLLLHWNGRTWTRVPAPMPGQDNELTGVSARSSTDAWAVGNFITASGVAPNLVLHWNGRTWVQVPAPSPSKDAGDTLNSVTALSGRDAWAVGSYLTRSNMNRTLILHWNGHTWTHS